jgi:hypothetical protein
VVATLIIMTMINLVVAHFFILDDGIMSPNQNLSVTKGTDLMNQIADANGPRANQKPRTVPTCKFCTG